MIFTSLRFLIFLTACVFLYYILPLKHRWLVLLGASMFFYLFVGRRRIIFILLSCISTWLVGILINKLHGSEKNLLSNSALNSADKKAVKKSCLAKRRLVLGVYLLFNLGILVLLKFYNTAANYVDVLPVLNLMLPIGISFYTLQVCGYIIDVHKKKVQAEKNFLKVMLFTTFFPQIVQGPISRFNQLEPQLVTGHRLEYNNIVLGFQRILWGFFKKLVIADRLAILTRTLYNGYEEYLGFYVVVAAFFYTIQLYADFSGGIDIAIGAGRLFGIEMQENFNRPLFSKNIAEFWRRWHISLGAWLRDYVYYPLNYSLTRRLIKYKHLVKWLPLFIALLVTWFLNGLWHGEGLQYICNGLWYGMLTMLGALIQKPSQRFWNKLNISQNSFILKAFRVIRTFACVATAQIMFGSSSFVMMTGLFKGMFSQWNPWVLFDGSLLLLGLDAADFAVALIAICILFLTSLFARRRNMYAALNSLELPLRWIIMLFAIFVIAVFGIYGPAYDVTSFIYFQF